jgi:hypothetical protein
MVTRAELIDVPECLVADDDLIAVAGERAPSAKLVCSKLGVCVDV